MADKLTGLLHFPENWDERRYAHLRRNIVILLGAVSIIPLCMMAVINFHIYKGSLDRELETPLKGLVNKSKHSFELYLNERLSAVGFMASIYSFEELSEEQMLSRVFHIAKQEFSGLVDLGVIDAEGQQVAYAGPYGLLGKNYAEQAWFNETRIRGTYISDVFMGYRNLPHIAIAVEGRTAGGTAWVLRATINTDRFVELIASMDVGTAGDAFLVTGEGVLQTHSQFFGTPLTQVPFPMPPTSYQGSVTQVQGTDGKRYMLAYANFIHPDFAIITARPATELKSSWYSLRSDLLFVLLGGALGIGMVAYWLAKRLVKRIELADQGREAIFREMEHTHKLSSIGRLSAGIAHEINNPLAIINEKAGLMKDLLAREDDSTCKTRLEKQLDGILNSVTRCRTITHRLLGFARRMEVTVEPLNINSVVHEVLGFLDKEARKRSVDVQLQLDDNMPSVPSDRGQLQQVVLNILSNALEAVEHGGAVTISSGTTIKHAYIRIEDNGCGIEKELLSHIFEPFYTTKKGTGTGLGLAISYGIIRKLGGHIEVESEPHIGTRFTVWLLRTQPASENNTT